MPIPETQPTVAPGAATYGARKVALERELLALGDRLPVTLLRAGAIHGPHGRAPRELYFVRRNLDGRRTRVLAHGGRSRFHPVSVYTLADLVRRAAARPRSRVLNTGDPEAPTVAEIGAAVDAVMGVETETVLLEGGPRGNVGLTPWSARHPVVYDMTAAERELGHRPPLSYREALTETVGCLVERLTEAGDRRETFPKIAARGDSGVGFFDYAAEDAWPARRERLTPGRAAPRPVSCAPGGRPGRRR